jgi:two-component system, OmpR family, response regulator VicR
MKQKKTIEVKKKILVADDDRSVITLLKNALESKGYLVITASNGQEALDKIFDVSPDLMILDIMMPLKDGYEVLAEIRKDPLYKILPVIMLTAKIGERDEEHAFEEGADHFMPKPFKIEEMLARIDSLLQY